MGFGDYLGTIGTIAGAGIGTLIAPGAGTAIGAGLGGALGGALQEQYGTSADEKFPASPFQAEQRQAFELLRRQAEQGDPVAREQLRQATGRLMAMQQAQAVSAAPQNAAMAARMASQNAARQQQALAGQTAMADIQARLGAVGQLGGLAGQARGQDIGRQQFLSGQQGPGMTDFMLSGLQTGAALQGMGIGSTQQAVTSGAGGAGKADGQPFQTSGDFGGGLPLVGIQQGAPTGGFPSSGLNFGVAPLQTGAPQWAQGGSF